MQLFESITTHPVSVLDLDNTVRFSGRHNETEETVMPKRSHQAEALSTKLRSLPYSAIKQC